MTPEAVGPDHAHAVATGERHQLPLPLCALSAGIGEARRDHDQSLHALHRALLHHPTHVLGRHGDDRQVDLTGQVEHRWPGADARHVGGLGVHRVHRADEAPAHQMTEHRVPDGAGHAGCSDDGDGVRAQQPLHRPCFGHLGPLLDGGQRLGGGVDRQLDLDDALLEPAGGAEAGLGEHPEHLAVLGQHRRSESGDPDLAGGDRQELQQDGGHAPTVVLVVDEEGDLGVAAGPVAVVAGDAHQLVADDADERHPIDVVDGGEVLDVDGRQTGSGREEAEVDALGRLALMEPHHALGVIGADGPHRHRAPVGQHHVGLPPLGVARAAARPGRRPNRRRDRVGADDLGRDLLHRAEATGGLHRRSGVVRR